MTGLNDCIGIFGEIEATSFRFRPKTKAPIRSLRTAMEIAAGLAPAEIAALRDRITPSLSLKLMYLGTLAAEEAVNAQDAGWLRVSLLVHVVENFKFDFRENFLRLFATEYAAWRMGVDIARMASELAPLTTVQARKLFGEVFNEPHGAAALQLANLSITEVEGEMRFAPA